MPPFEHLKVFIASPGGLESERKRFYIIVGEVNRMLDSNKGIYLEACGWEDTLRGSGRPQTIINDEIKQCDIIVFLLWKRWGSPPATSSRYSSGFEEEWELANTLNASTGRPEIFLYLRGDMAALEDVDKEQIEKVTDFRNRIKEEKKNFAQIYDTVNQWERLFRQHLFQWINRYSTNYIESKRGQVPFRKFEPPDDSTLVQHKPANYFGYWHSIATPDSSPNLISEIYNPGNCGSSINKIAISIDGATIWAVVRDGSRNGLLRGGAQTILLQSNNRGYSWNDLAYSKLTELQSSMQNGTHIWDIAVAPDNPDVIVIVCADIVKSPLIQEIWLTEDRGKTWTNTKWPPDGVIAGRHLIGCIDLSAGYRKHTILVGTRDGTGLGRNNLQINKLDTSKGWLSSNNPPTGFRVTQITGDVIAARLSPNFNSDYGIAVVYSDGRPIHSGTWLATGTYNVENNSLRWEDRGSHIKLRHTRRRRGDSPRCEEIVTAQLELPPDYYHLDHNSKRFYISIDAIEPTPKRTPHRGIFRVLNNKLETLMDTTEPEPIGTGRRTRRISSIAYAPGKLLAGEVVGFSDSANVHTWFMDVSNDKKQCCWWPCLKPTSGGAVHEKSTYDVHRYGYGNAIVKWAPDATLAYVATGAASLGKCVIPNIDQCRSIMADNSWPAGYVRVVPCDESAFAISRNNGETWNQTSLVNTYLAKITDFACGTDNSTFYITSNSAGTGYLDMHSIWRTTINPSVAAPMPAIPPIGTHWERVFHFRDKEDNKTGIQSIVRTIWSCTDKRDGEVVGWALKNTKELYWSPDFGDYWALVNIADGIVDFTFESSTMIYALYTGGYIQRIPYAGVAWATHLPIVSTRLVNGHCVTSCADGVFVGASEGTSAFALSFSLDNGRTWNVIQRGTGIPGNVHVVVDCNFRNNHLLYVFDDSKNGKCYRIQVDSFEDWIKCDMGCPTGKRLYGAIMAFTGRPEPALYVAYSEVAGSGSGILRCLLPRSPIPGGFKWDVYNQFADIGESYSDFSLEPSALKAAGCCTLDTHTSLYAIDNNYYSGNSNLANHLFGLPTVSKKGLLWQFIDITGKNVACDISD